MSTTTLLLRTPRDHPAAMAGHAGGHRCAARPYTRRRLAYAVEQVAAGMLILGFLVLVLFA